MANMRPASGPAITARDSFKWVGSLSGPCGFERGAGGGASARTGSSRCGSADRRVIVSPDATEGRTGDAPS